MIVEFKSYFGKVIRNLKTVKDDIIHSIIPIGESSLAAVNNKGELRIWNIETTKCVK